MDRPAALVSRADGADAAGAPADRVRPAIRRAGAPQCGAGASLASAGLSNVARPVAHRRPLSGGLRAGARRGRAGCCYAWSQPRLDRPAEHGHAGRAVAFEVGASMRGTARARSWRTLCDPERDLLDLL